jgi:hypothetical protein
LQICRAGRTSKAAITGREHRPSTSSTSTETANSNTTDRHRQGYVDLGERTNSTTIVDNLARWHMSGAVLFHLSRQPPRMRDTRSIETGAGTSAADARIRRCQSRWTQSDRDQHQTFSGICQYFVMDSLDHVSGEWLDRSEDCRRTPL